MFRIQKIFIPADNKHCLCIQNTLYEFIIIRIPVFLNDFSSSAGVYTVISIWFPSKAATQLS